MLEIHMDLSRLNTPSNFILFSTKYLSSIFFLLFYLSAIFFLCLYHLSIARVIQATITRRINIHHCSDVALLRIEGDRNDIDKPLASDCTMVCDICPTVEDYNLNPITSAECNHLL